MVKKKQLRKRSLAAKEYSLSYLLLRAFCKVPQSYQQHRRERCIRLLVFYICKMKKIKLSPNANFDLIADTLSKVVGGEYSTFRSFIDELRSPLSEMTAYERMDMMILLKQLYDEHCRFAKRK